MIRKLVEEDNNKLMRLIMEEPEFNVYILGDIENLGYNHDFLEYFGEFDENGILSAVLVRYFSTFIFYAKNRFDILGFVDLIKSYDKIRMLIGKTNIVSKFEGTLLELNKSGPQHFAALKEINSSFKIDKKIVVKKAKVEDIQSIVKLRERIKEFSSGIDSFREMLLNDFRAGTSHGYYVQADDKIVAYAQTTAENSMSAMLVNVMTDKEYRKRGFASACLKVLCDDLINQKKTLCLFYKNPEAGKLYKRIGFQEIGLWSIFTKTEK